MDEHEQLIMYILVKKTITPGIGVVGVAHASLACYLKYTAHPLMQEWLSKSFRKVICAVDDKQFEEAKKTEDYSLITESSLDNMETVLAFRPRPRNTYPRGFYFFGLYLKIKEPKAVTFRSMNA